MPLRDPGLAEIDASGPHEDDSCDVMLWASRRTPPWFVVTLDPETRLKDNAASYDMVKSARVNGCWGSLLTASPEVPLDGMGLTGPSPGAREPRSETAGQGERSPQTDAPILIPSNGGPESKLEAVWIDRSSIELLRRCVFFSSFLSLVLPNPF